MLHGMGISQNLPTFPQVHEVMFDPVQVDNIHTPGASGGGSIFQKDTLPETNIAMENPQVWWYLPGKMGFSRAMLVSGRVFFPGIGHMFLFRQEMSGIC